MADDKRIPIGDFNDIQEQISILTKSLLANATDDIGKFFTDLIIRLRILERQVDEYKRYTPIIYNQTAVDNVIGDGIFNINIGLYTPVTQSLLMMLPKESSINGDNKLVMYRSGEEVMEFEIFKESNTGELKPIQKGDIVPNRTVLFRLIFHQIKHPRAVIINTSGLYNENISNLYVSGEVLFNQAPIISGGTSENRLITKDELDTVKQNLKDFESKFIFTKKDAYEVADDPETPDGAIIIQIEDDWF